jgi:hypothetical protein
LGTNDRDLGEISWGGASGYTPSNLTKLLEVTKDPRWEDNLDAMTQTITFIHRGWKSLTDSERAQVFDAVGQKFPRIRKIPEDREIDVLGRGVVNQRRYLFGILMSLESDIDIHDALLCDPEAFPEFIYSEDEELYLELGGFLGEFIDVYKHCQVPVAFLFWSGVMVLSAVARYNLYVKLGNYTEKLNIFAFLVGPSGSGKSDAMGFGRDLLLRTNRHLLSEKLNPDGTPNGEILERPDWRINLIPSDSTPEGIIDYLEEVGKLRQLDSQGNFTDRAVHCTGILLVDEVADHWGEDNWGSGRKTPFYTSIYSRDYHEKQTVARGRQTLENLCFSLMGCGAPEWFKDVVSPHVLKGGFVDRTHYIYRRGSIRNYSNLDVPIKDPLRAESLAHWLTQWARSPVGIRRRAMFSEEAVEWIRNNYTLDRDQEIKIQQGSELPSEDDLDGTQVRNYNHIVKMAVILSISDDSFPDVTLHHIKLASRIIEEEKRWFSVFMGQVTQNSTSHKMQAIKDYFRRQNWRAQEGRMCAALFKKVGNKREIMSLLEELVEAGLVKLVKRGKAVRDNEWEAYNRVEWERFI